MGCFSHRKRTPETNFDPNIKHFEIIFVDQDFPNRKLISPAQEIKKWQYVLKLVLGFGSRS